MAQTYKIDFGGTSPFVVYGASGETVFDASIPVLRAYMVGATAVIPHRAYDPLNLYSYLPEHGSSAFATVTFGKTFSEPPLFCCLAYADHFYTVVANGLYAPMIMLQDFASGGNVTTAFGMLANSYTDHMAIANFDYQYSITGHYMVFENGADG